MENYTLVRKIGEGSFGKALLVKRNNDNKQCVVKQISISKMSSKEREESKKEVCVLSQLKHPNIVSYIESFLGDGNLYIVMDYCEGGDLYQLIVRQRGGHLDESKVLDIFVQCCLAVKHIHDRKILHRDIKTQNIFLTKHHIVKLGDFGIARVLKSTMELARTCIGTPYYLSPEIVENKPYNNKSDVWSLGCVLYELATLKHAFQAGNMKNLVLKICRGSYNPVPNKYSFELRSLVAHCLKRSASDRPSINTLLKKPIIQQRIHRFLSEEEVQEEFSHTVIHRVPAKEPASKPKSAANILPKKQTAAKRQKEQLAAVYGVSVAKRPVAALKPPPARPAAKQKVAGRLVQGSKHTGKREIDARERRRKEILAQEQKYNDYMKKIQKQRWEKQQAIHMNRAREAGWKNVLCSDEVKRDAMKKYQPETRRKDEEKKLSETPEEKPVQKILPENVKKEKKATREEQVPVKEKLKQQPQKTKHQFKGNEKPAEKLPLKQEHVNVKKQKAWNDDVRERHRNLVNGPSVASEYDSERKKILDDFWQRKKEAAANKARGMEALQGVNPLLKLHEERMAKERIAQKPPQPSSDAVVSKYPGARNQKEVEYLKQLEVIRRQNFAERKAVKVGHYQPIIPESIKRPPPDPRYDADARKKKIEALKEQAEQRAALLKEQLEIRRKKVQDQMEQERQERMRKWREEKDRPISGVQKKEVDKCKAAKDQMIVPSVGIETAMGQVNQPKLFRSLSEGEIKNLVKPTAQRKNWEVNEKQLFPFMNIPLEITASAMEATKIADQCNENESTQKMPFQSDECKNNPQRKGWDNEGKTQFLYKLNNMELIGTVAPTLTLHSSDEQDEQSLVKETITTTQNDTITISSTQKHNNDTIILSKGDNNHEDNEPQTDIFKDDEKAPNQQGVTVSKAPIPSKPSGTITLSGPPSTKNTPVIQPSKIEKDNGNVILMNDNVKSDILTEASGSKVDVNISGNKGNVIVVSSDANENLDKEIKKTGQIVVSSASQDNNDEKIAENKNKVESSLIKEENAQESQTIEDPNDLQNEGEIEDIGIEDVIDLASEVQTNPPNHSPNHTNNNSLNSETKSAWNFNEVNTNVEKTPEKQTTGNEESVEESDQEESFHTPNRSFGLQSGSYDVTEKKLLRTCSLPDLRQKISSLESSEENNVDSSDVVKHSFESVELVEDSRTSQPENDVMLEDIDDEIESDNAQLAKCDVHYDGENDVKETDGLGESDDVKERSGVNNAEDEDEKECEDEEEYKDYESMLESMRNVLGSATAHPNNGTMANEPGSTTTKNEGDIDDEEEDDDQWGEDDDIRESQTAEQPKDSMEDSIFSRIEESRNALENELGFDLFIKVYRYVEMMQENENDALEIGANEITELLGEKEHLYQKILYLVIADSAYSEGNDGT